MTVAALVGTIAASLPSLAGAAQGDNVIPVLGAPTHTASNAQAHTMTGTGIARMVDGSGYFVLSEDGRVQTFGSAVWLGNAPPTGAPDQWTDIAVTPNGYWLLSARGTVSGHGTAPFVGTLPGQQLNDRLVAITSHHVMGGWALSEGGTVYALGGAPLFGSPRHERMRFVDIAATADGYRVLAADGSVRRYSAAIPDGVLEVAATRTGTWDATALAATPSGAFWIVSEDGTTSSHGGAAVAPNVDTQGQGRIVSAEATADGSAFWALAQGMTNGGGEVVGTLTNANNEPIADACVRAYYEGTLRAVGGARSNPDGSFRVGTLIAGSYRLFADDCEAGEYIGEWYPDKERPEFATNIVVGSGGAVVAQDFQLTKGSFLTGTVENDAGDPLARMCVGVHDVSGSIPGASPTSTTSITGSYRLVVRAGTYEVKFADCADGEYLGEWYDDQRYRANADLVTLAPEGSAALNDAVLSPAAVISGVVTNPAGQAITNACVSTEDPEGRTLHTRITSTTGYYRIGGLDSGSYKVRFGNCSFVDERFRSVSQADYADEWSGDSPTRDGATPVDAVAGILTTADAVLQRGGGISGVVTGPNAAPLAGICVDLFDGTTPLGTTSTSTTGFYKFRQLGARPYHVRYGDCANKTLAYEWWNDAPTAATSAPIVGQPDSTVTGYDVQMATGGSITGRVTDITGAPLGDICVAIHEPGGPPVTAVRTNRPPTSTAGTYRVTGLAAAGYEVSFNDCSFFPRHDLAQTWYAGPSGDGVPLRGDATPVVVAGTAETANVNSVMTRSGTVTGVVKNAAGNGVPGVCVRTQHGTDYAVGVTSITGLYSIRGLHSGSYHIQFVDCLKHGYSSEWFNDAASQAGAATLGIGPGTAAGGIDAVLAVAAAQETVPPGGTVTTDEPTAGDPIQVGVTSPSGGAVSVYEGVSAAAPPSYDVLGHAVEITAPPASADAPMALAFTLLESELGGVDPDDVVVFRDGVAVVPCVVPGARPIDPNPCALPPESGTSGAGATWTFTVLAEHASTWQLGVRQMSSPTLVGNIDPLPTRNTLKPGAIVPVRFDVGGDFGLGILDAATSTVVPCGTGPADAVEQVLKKGAGGLTFDAATEQYVYTWVTDRSWRKSCRELTIRLTNGTEVRALFDLR